VGLPRILHVSDIHCANDRLESLLSQASGYDVIVASGDFECVDTARLLLELAAAPVVAVTGNLDNAAVARVLRDAGVLLDGRLASVGGLAFAGVGGLDAHGSMEALLRRASEEGVSRVDVLVTHHPPRGVLDRTFIGVRAGLRELWSVIERLRPSVHLFGHIHEAGGVHSENGTVFVNPGPLKRGWYAVVEGPPWRAERRRL